MTQHQHQWKRSKRGNLFVECEGIFCVVFHREGAWSYLIELPNRPGPWFPNRTYDSEQVARNAAEANLDGVLVLARAEARAESESRRERQGPVSSSSEPNPRALAIASVKETGAIRAGNARIRAG